jgi:cobalamin biosynthesis Mg chelatase CobN
MGISYRNRKTTSHKAGGITYRTTTSYGKNGPRTTHSSSSAGHTSSVSFSNGKTRRTSTVNHGNGQATVYTSSSGGRRRGRKSKSDPLSTLILIVAFGIFWLVATIYHGIASLFH